MTSSWFSGAMPMPVSETEKRMRSWSSGEAVMVMVPDSVNLSAFEMKLRRIWDELAFVGVET